jgi:hypothetical protein
VSTVINYLNAIYSEKTINSILDFAINQNCEIHFINKLTNVPRPLTRVQLMGMKKFRGVNILLETGQTYQIGLEMDGPAKGTYQEIYLADLVVDKATLEQIKHTFGQGDKNP